MNPEYHYLPEIYISTIVFDEGDQQIKICMKNNKIIYSLTIEGIQNVACEELNRNLTDEEVNKITESIAEKEARVPACVTKD